MAVPGMNRKIFIIDDERDILDILEINLKGEGYEVFSFINAENALPALEKTRPALCIVDIMMGGIDGFEFCRRLRSDDRWKAVPIIFLSARTEEFDKVLGLELGADDYIAKPFSVREVLSRVKAVLRRASDQTSSGEGTVLKYRGVELYPEKYTVTVDGTDVKMTRTEFELLRLFLRYPGKVFTRDNIIDSIRGDDVYVVDRTIDVHVMNLRKKLGPYKDVISTFSGVGYGIKT